MRRHAVVLMAEDVADLLAGRTVNTETASGEHVVMSAEFGEAGLAIRGQGEEGQCLVTLWPEAIEFTGRDGDNDTWAIPLRYDREE